MSNAGNKTKQTKQTKQKKLAMLAHSYDPDKITYPCYVQPKLDGIRCIAIVKQGESVQLLTRDNKDILSMDHIKAELMQLADGMYDGELFTPDLPFEEINGIVRRQYHNEESLKVHYYVYDIIRADVYGVRFKYLQDSLKSVQLKYISLVENITCISSDSLVLLCRDYIARGFEGAMIRLDRLPIKATKTREYAEVDIGYESEALNNKRRSWSLLKYKDFQDAEFKIVGIEEEYDLAGQPKGRTGAFRLDVGDGRIFKASGLTDHIKEDSWCNPDKYIGKYGTIKYFELSSDGIPRFPNFKCLREEEVVD